MFEFFVAYHVVRDLAATAATSPIVVATMWAECEFEALIASCRRPPLLQELQIFYRMASVHIRTEAKE